MGRYNILARLAILASKITVNTNYLWKYIVLLAHNVVNQQKTTENNFYNVSKTFYYSEWFIQSFIFERKHEIFYVFSVNISTFKNGSWNYEGLFSMNTTSLIYKNVF